MLGTSTPTLTGTAGTANGDSTPVTIAIFPGSDTTGQPVRFVTGSRDSSSHFAIRITRGLDDGRYC